MPARGTQVVAGIFMTVGAPGGLRSRSNSAASPRREPKSRLVGASRITPVCASAFSVWETAGLGQGSWLPHAAQLADPPCAPKARTVPAVLPEACPGLPPCQPCCRMARPRTLSQALMVDGNIFAVWVRLFEK